MILSCSSTPLFVNAVFCVSLETSFFYFSNNLTAVGFSDFIGFTSFASLLIYTLISTDAG